MAGKPWRLGEPGANSPPWPAKSLIPALDFRLQSWERTGSSCFGHTLFLQPQGARTSARVCTLTCSLCRVLPAGLCCVRLCTHR